MSCCVRVVFLLVVLTACCVDVTDGEVMSCGFLCLGLWESWDRVERNCVLSLDWLSKTCLQSHFFDSLVCCFRQNGGSTS